MCSGRSRFQSRLQQLRIRMDFLRLIVRGSVLTLLRRPLFIDFLAWSYRDRTGPALNASRDLCLENSSMLFVCDEYTCFDIYIYMLNAKICWCLNCKKCLAGMGFIRFALFLANPLRLGLWSLRSRPFFGTRDWTSGLCWSWMGHLLTSKTLIRAAEHLSGGVTRVSSLGPAFYVVES